MKNERDSRMSYLDKMRFRKTWTINPCDRVHGEGKKGNSYNRTLDKRNWKDELEEEEDENRDEQ